MLLHNIVRTGEELLKPQLKVKIQRNVTVQTHPFIDYFKGFEKVEAVRQIFGERTDEVLRNLRVEFVGSRRAYMGVSDSDGHLIVGAHYLKNGDITEIYLDVIHELVHLKQFMDGKELFESRFDYVDRPTEIEAYLVAVKEARRLGLSERQISTYLRTEWMTDDEFKRLANTLNVKCE
jgi:hypothetical protein